MKQYLKKVGFEFDSGELDPMIQLLAGAHNQRVEVKSAKTSGVTRSTAIVVFAQMLPQISRGLEAAGLDWQGFREEVGLPGDIIASDVDDIELHQDFQTAISRFAERHMDRRIPTPAALATAIVEMIATDRETGVLAKRFEKFGLNTALMPTEFPEPELEDVTKSESESEPEHLHPAIAWICQYRPGDRVTRWTQDAHPGAIIPWKTEQKALPREMLPGDPVIYWRSVDPKNKDDRGGLVGTGHIVSIELERQKVGANRFPTKVQEFFEDELIPRDEVIAFSGIDRTVWRGAVLELAPDQALKVDELLRNKGRKPLSFRTSKRAQTPAPTPEDGQLRIRRDAPELDHDALGRAPLAVSLAWTLHEIWCTEQGLRPYRKGSPKDDAPGFVAHIDSPWGGGKTTFANLVARTLSPGLNSRIPEFLQELYDDRQDMSGLFISAAHEKGQLKDEFGEYRWEARARQPWIVVSFNAWLHQHVEPPWWCFYQTIRKTCFRAIRREGVPTVCQDDDGSYRTKKESCLDRFDQWFDLWKKETLFRLTSGKVLIPLAIFAVSLAVGLLLWDYGAIAKIDNNAVLSTSTGIGLVISFLTGAGSFLTAAVTVFADALAPGRNLAGERVVLGSGDPLTRFRIHFSRMMRDINRPVLVVVDDLDRCKPQFIVELTRGLQTILVSPRIVYLILGDRNWIEKAFEIQHHNMSDIDVGPEHTFGGRFVEKVIQLSFVLPALADRQEEYVREVLVGRPARSPEMRGNINSNDGSGELPSHATSQVTETGTNEQARVRETLSNRVTLDEIDKSGAELEQQLQDAGNSASNRRYRQTVRQEVILRRAAQKEAVQEAIRHRLQPLGEYLPHNPRHIKRIINAISLYQDSVLLGGGSLVESAVGKKHWRQLVIGVVLMMGYPRSWSTLTANPELADYVVGKAKPNDQTTNTELQEQLAMLRSNDSVVGLLCKTQFSEESGGSAVETIVDADAIRWINQIIPISA